MSIKTDAIVIRDETTTGANTATRVGRNLVDIADDLISKQAAIDLNNAKVGVTNEEANPDVVGQAEAESGTSTTERIWTAERVKQAIVALGGSGSVDDTAYGISWNGVTGTAPSKNALYDFIESQVFKVDINSNISPIYWGGTQAEYDIDFPSGHTSEYFIVITDGVVPPTTASDIVVDASGFSSNLSATDTDVQTALGTLDALVASGTMTDAEVKIAYENNADTNAFTDAEKVIVGNTSGTNTGDNAVNTLYSGLITNATHTGEVTGSGALTLDATAISNKTLDVALTGTEEVLINDGGLKKTTTQAIADLGGGGGKLLESTVVITNPTISGGVFDTTLVAAQGVGKMIIPTNVSMVCVNGSSSTSSLSSAIVFNGVGSEIVSKTILQSSGVEYFGSTFSQSSIFNATNYENIALNARVKGATDETITGAFHFIVSYYVFDTTTGF